MIAMLLAMWMQLSGETANVLPETLDACPMDARAIDEAGIHRCRCSADDTRGGGVWGTDIYTDDSRIGRAAVHGGTLTDRGGMVRFRIERGRSRYRGSERQGVVSRSWSAAPRSIRFLRRDEGDNEAVARCPDDGSRLAFGLSLRCLCLARDTEGGEVFGSGVYTDGSRLCRAAVHAGMIGENGGVILVRRTEGLQSYTGSARNGILSRSYGAWPGSVRVIAGEGNF